MGSNWQLGFVATGVLVRLWLLHGCFDLYYTVLEYLVVTLASIFTVPTNAEVFDSRNKRDKPFHYCRGKPPLPSPHLSLLILQGQTTTSPHLSLLILQGQATTSPLPI